MAKLNILHVSPEVAPYARTGGLGDVLGALPKALAKLGHQVKVFLPLYRGIDFRSDLAPLPGTIEIPDGAGATEITLEWHRDPRTRVEYYFVRHDTSFDRPEFYRDPATGKDYPDNDSRFRLFCLGVLAAVRRMGWRPHVIHCHDWQAALVPVYRSVLYGNDALFQGVKTVQTIHNIGYQGLFSADRFAHLGVPDRLFYAMTGPFEFFGKVNFLKAGISFADRITTVSPRYAVEIQSGDQFGCGLQGILRERSSDVTGILNGVDYTVWSPSRDHRLPYRYTVNNLSGKQKNKVELLRQIGLPLRDKVPLIGMITRLTPQKGLDLLEDAADELLVRPVQLVVLGTGDEQYHAFLQKLERTYPDKVRVFLKFDDALAHRIEAAADMLLMPSRYEPCGLNQLYSLKYGTVPIVHQVGGLADTVHDYDPATGEGTGFVFDDYSAAAMLAATERALALFPRRRPWTHLMKNGMSQDFSWEHSARLYSGLYETLAG